MIQNLELISILKPHFRTQTSAMVCQSLLACQVHCKGYEHVPPSPVPGDPWKLDIQHTEAALPKRNYSSQGFRVSGLLCPSMQMKAHGFQRRAVLALSCFPTGGTFVKREPAGLSGGSGG